MLALVPLLLAAPVPTRAVAADREPLHTYRARSDVRIQLFDDGGFRFLDTDSGQALLEGRAAGRSGWAQRGRPDTAPFTACAPEGIAAGRRGAPARADDDDDGLTDEDPLDGRDNDGDGLIDEDFAAISDAMVVVDADGGARRTEFYHWAYPHLASALFLHLSGQSDPARRSDYRLELPLGDWIEAPVTHRRHGLVGRPEVERHDAFVAKLDYPGVREDGRWVGVMVLTGDDEKAGPDPAPIRIERSRLDLLHDGGRDFVVCLADSWLQLNRLLCDAARVERGMTDPVSGRATHWVVPPACPLCRQCDRPGFEWTVTAGSELLLEMTIDENSAGLPDPDLFRLGGVELGSPYELIWSPTEGAVHAVRWTEMMPALLVDPVPELSDPYAGAADLCGHGAEGVLTLRFVPSDEVLAQLSIEAPDHENTSLDLRGRWLDGRPLRNPAIGRIEPDPAANASGEFAAPATAADEVLEPIRDSEADSDRLSLASNLLSGFPNPFREAVQVRFRIPQTVGEAFEPDEDKGWPAELDLRAPVPWRNGSPFVTVKIYRINGQELVTLFADYLSSGEMNVHWDGTDRYGRSVAAGPYFCKLQMDDWSVTRQIIYLR